MRDITTIATFENGNREIEVQAERMYDGSTLYTAWLTTSADVYEYQYTDVDKLNGYLRSQGFDGIAPVKF